MKIILFLLLPCSLLAQTMRPIITAFPSLSIPTSSRGLSMGDCGVASAIENQQLYYNPSKIAFTKNFNQVAASYTPYLVGISPDIKMLSLQCVTTTGNTSAFGISLQYLSLGYMETKDDNGATISIYKSNEFNVAGHYAIQLGSKASLGLGLRMLASQPVQYLSSVTTSSVPKSILSASADLSFYQYYDLDQSGKKLELGIAISNFGPKVKLTGSDDRTFLPTNLGLGIAYSSYDRSTGDRFTVGLDFNKLLVPSPGQPSVDYSTITPIKALFSSFSDAPGGAPEELQEIRVNTGIEYGFTDQFFLRGGISLENQLKGNRKYIGIGTGYKLNVHDQSWGIDFHYLVPFGTATSVSPFQNSYGFTLKINFGNFD